MVCFNTGEPSDKSDIQIIEPGRGSTGGSRQPSSQSYVGGEFTTLFTVTYNPEWLTGGL